MEQTYQGIIHLEDQEKAALMAAPIHETVNQFAGKLFNAKAFEVKGGEATGFFSLQIDQEFVSFIEPVSLDASHSEVLGNLEDAMNKAVMRDVHFSCKNWSATVSEYTGAAQAVLVGDEVHYTNIVGEAIPNSLSSAEQKMKEIIHNLVELSKNNLSAAHRTLLTSRIIIALTWHKVAKRLAQAEIKDVKDDLWKSVLKFYFSEDGVFALIDDFNMRYGYQYQANCSLLAVTEMTELCYRNAANAVCSKRPHASIGPAGTGKTETIKDLAHKLGRRSFVVNLSDKYQKEDLVKLLQVGCLKNTWLIFDEFNRLIPAMLDVVEEYLKLIFEARQKMIFKVQHEGDNLVIQMDSSFDLGIFITLNPGYKGRAQLPAGIKSMLSETEMKIPDFAILAQFMLASSGFQEHEKLGLAIREVMVACKEKLTKQAMYDWGLRKMKQIISQAAKIMIEEGSKGEQESLCCAFKLSVNAYLMEEDCEAFDVILTENGFAPKDFVKVLNTKATIPTGYTAEQFQHKAYLFEQLVKYRHTLMVMGLGTNFTRLVAESNGWHVEVLENYGQQSNNEMYGTSDNRTGILPTMLKRCISGDLSKKEGLKLIVLQGEVNADWVESMASLCDDNKRLSLSWGEHINMTSDIRIVFETNLRTCRNLTPATISRQGMLFFTEAWTDTSQEEIDAKGLVKDVYGNWRLPSQFKEL